MATNSIEIMVPKKYQDQESSLQITKKQNKPQLKPEKKVAVIYYLSRNGQFEHPHFVEVPLSSAQGLYLRDVLKTLNLLRGQGMTSMYSWASKRSYKNGYIWQDLSDDDFIHPCQSQDYILKGSLLDENSQSFRSNESISSSTSRRSSEMNSFTSENSNSSVTRRKNHSPSSIEHKVYKAKTAGELSRKGSNVSTQTDNDQTIKLEIEEAEPELEGLDIMKYNSETSDNLEKSIEIYRSAANVTYQKVGRDHNSERRNDTKLLMKLIGCGCGSKRFKDFESMKEKKY
ncbi:hypothetical protein JCGZ_18443 [Jatropha curcas]|uniref:SOSEKI DIX-like domain-containing protein n=1 Tax=Jatropha curcas TaxID=180498 RepID=A0A067K4A0_JATCU|nr:hypothetical protein JCGZ_18443 [Jatropha curcas]